MPDAPHVTDGHLSPYVGTEPDIDDIFGDIVHGIEERIEDNVSGYGS